MRAWLASFHFIEPRWLWLLLLVPVLAWLVGRASGGSRVLAKLAEGQSVEGAVSALSGKSNVRFAEPNYLYQHNATPTDPQFTNGTLWGMLGDASTPANQYGSQAAEAWAKRARDRPAAGASRPMVARALTRA